jgi:ribonuclease R
MRVLGEDYPKLEERGFYDKLCMQASRREKEASDAERGSIKYKQVEYMQSYVGDEFDAVISGVASFGFWAETVAHKCEGMVSIADLSVFDDFELKDGEYALVGRHTGKRFAMGDNVRVRVVSANLEKRQIDYAILDMPVVKLAHKRSVTKRKK